MCDTSLPLHKRVCFFGASQKGIKIAETPRKHLGHMKISTCTSAIVSQIPNQYPDQPESSGAAGQNDIQDQTGSAALLSIVSTHQDPPYLSFCELHQKPWKFLVLQYLTYWTFSA